MKHKKAQGPIGFAVVFGLIALVVGGALIYANKSGLFSAAEKDAGDKTAITDCSSETTPDIDPNAYDAYAPGTALTEATNLYRRVGDKAWTSFTQGTAITGLTVGQKYEMVFGISTSDFTDNAYGPKIVTGRIPCKEAVDFTDTALFQDEIENSLTATYYNDNHDASASSFSTGDSKNMYLRFEAANNEIFGNPYLPDTTPNVLCMNLNSSEWDVPEKVSVHEGYAVSVDANGNVQTTSLAGTELKKVGSPIRHTAVASMIAYCYEAPLVTEDGLEIKVKANADDTNAPGTDMTAHIYAANWYINSDTGDLEYGIEDQDGNAVGTDASDSLTMDFT